MLMQQVKLHLIGAISVQQQQRTTNIFLENLLIECMESFKFKRSYLFKWKLMSSDQSRVYASADNWQINQGCQIKTWKIIYHSLRSTHLIDN